MRITDKGQLEAYGTSWRSTPDHGLAFDPKMRELLYRTSDMLLPNKDIRQLTPREATAMGIAGKHTKPFLYAPHWKDSHLPRGTVFAARTGYRPQPAIFITESR